jgi:dynein heavy chain
MALCFSPVGDSFKARARKFPALVNCTVIDWFQDWPQDALLSVAQKFFSEINLGDEQAILGVTTFMPFSFKIVNDVCVKYKDTERRYAYTTPKSFLELIKLFNNMLSKKRDDIENNKERLERRLVKLMQTGEIAANLKEDLKIKTVEGDEKKEFADKLAKEVGREKAKVMVETEKANLEALRSRNELKPRRPFVRKSLPKLSHLSLKPKRPWTHLQ